MLGMFFKRKNSLSYLIGYAKFKKLRNYLKKLKAQEKRDKTHQSV